MNGQRVRELGLEDVDLWRMLRAEGLRLFPWAFLVTVEEAEAVGRAADEAAMARGGRFAVFDGERAVGIAALRRMGLSRIRHRAELGPFYISPAAQGTGAARVLLEAMVRHARRIGLQQVELFVASDNPRAIAFYERAGFVRHGRVPDAVMMPDGPLDDFYYVMRLEPDET